MSNQIVISSGAKVRSLEGVLTGTAGIVSSVPLGAANGVATLDSSGKVPLSQLPASVVTYLGTWNAATNTPTLANGTGDVGDLYICNVAGTVNFGAGPITFAVGDWVIYSGTEWQKSSGATGTVTSVAVTESGDALTITGSPITTAGTINIGFAGNSTQYINGEGNLVTFPTIITEAQNLITDVYNETGATLTKGTVVYINGGHGNLPTVTKALATSDATSAQTYGVVQADISNNNNGHVVVIGSLGDLDTQAYAAGTQLYLSSTTAGAWTSVKQYAPAHLVYVGIVVRSHPTQGVVEIKIQNGFELDELHNVSAQTPSNNDGLFYNSSNSLWENKSIATALGYTPANAATYVPYTGATSNVDLGIYNLIANNRIVGSAGSGGSAYSNTIFVSSTSITSGYENTIIGWGVASTLTTGYYNTAVGGESLALITTGNDNTAFGGYALSTATGSYNTGIGSGAGRSIGSGSYNTIIGGYNGTSGMSSNVILSDGAGNIRYRFDGTNNNFYQNVNFGSTLGNGTYTYTLPSATGTLALTSDIPSLTNYVTLNGSQTITGIKTFSNEQLFGNGITLTGGYITYTSGAYNLTLNTNILTANRNIFLKDGSGTLAFTSDIPSLSGYVQGSGTTNYHAKFTAGSTIGNSMLTDDGTTLQSIGATRSNLYLKAASNSYYSQLAFTNGSNGSFGGLSYNNASQYMQFEVNSSEYMRLYGNGNLRLFSSSATDNGSKFQVEGTAAISGTLTANGVTIGASDVRSSSGTLTLGGTSEIMRLNSTGVGIKTSSPEVDLQVGANSGIPRTMSLRYSSVPMYMSNTWTGTYSKAVLSINYYDTSNGSSSISSFSNVNYAAGSIELRSAVSGSDILFNTITSVNTAPTERMRITSGGDVTIGKTSYDNSTTGITLVGNGNVGLGLGSFVTDGQPCLLMNRKTSTGTLMVIRYNNGDVGSISTNGTTTSYNITSDYRLKQDLIDFNGLNLISAIRIYDYEWKSDKSRMYGVIAHELQEVIPYAVSGEKDGEQMQGVDYSKLVPVLVKAIQELQAQIEELKALINK